MKQKSVKNQTENALASWRALASAVLQRCALFSECGPETFASFLADGRLQRMERGQTLCRQGEQVDHLCLIVDGSLEVSTTTRTGKRHVVRYLEPGQIMNLIPVLDEHPAVHDGVAHTECLVLLLDRALVQRTLIAEPLLARSLLRLLCLRARLVYNDLSHHALLPVRQRCARALLSLVEPYGMPRAEGISISLKLSQDEFADMLGRSRPVINRELKQLERDGVIQTTYSHFVVLDIQQLRAVAAGAA